MQFKLVGILLSVGVLIIIFAWLVTMYGGFASSRLPVGEKSTENSSDICERSCADFEGRERQECLTSCAVFIE